MIYEAIAVAYTYYLLLYVTMNLLNNGFVLHSNKKNDVKHWGEILQQNNCARKNYVCDNVTVCKAINVYYFRPGHHKSKISFKAVARNM